MAGTGLGDVAAFGEDDEVCESQMCQLFWCVWLSEIQLTVVKAPAMRSLRLAQIFAGTVPSALFDPISVDAFASTTFVEPRRPVHLTAPSTPVTPAPVGSPCSPCPKSTNVGWLSS